MSPRHKEASTGQCAFLGAGLSQTIPRWTGAYSSVSGNGESRKNREASEVMVGQRKSLMRRENNLGPSARNSTQTKAA